MSAPEPTWPEVVAPLVQKLSMHSVVNEQATLNPEACRNIALLLHQMATQLSAAGIGPGDMRT